MKNLHTPKNLINRRDNNLRKGIYQARSPSNTFSSSMKKLKSFEGRLDFKSIDPKKEAKRLERNNQLRRLNTGIFDKSKVQKVHFKQKKRDSKDTSFIERIINKVVKDRKKLEDSYFKINAPTSRKNSSLSAHRVSSTNTDRFRRKWKDHLKTEGDVNLSVRLGSLLCPDLFLSPNIENQKRMKYKICKEYHSSSRFRNSPGSFYFTQKYTKKLSQPSENSQSSRNERIGQGKQLRVLQRKSFGDKIIKAPIRRGFMIGIKKSMIENVRITLMYQSDSVKPKLMLKSTDRTLFSTPKNIPNFSSLKYGFGLSSRSSKEGFSLNENSDSQEKFNLNPGRSIVSQLFSSRSKNNFMKRKDKNKHPNRIFKLHKEMILRNKHK